MKKGYVINYQINNVPKYTRFYPVTLKSGSLEIGKRGEKHKDKNTLYVVDDIPSEWQVVLKLKGIKWILIDIPDNFYFYIEDEYLPLSLYYSEVEAIEDLLGED